MQTVSSILAMAFCAAIAEAGLRSSNSGNSLGFVKALEFKHRLRVCNAYPYAGALELFRGKSEKMTERSLPYKSCEDFKAQLKAGDKLEFKVGDANAGTFSVSDLPNNDAVLFLVIYRHDTLSTAVSFESHVFANLLNAQIAVIDTYKGQAKSTLSIADQESAKTARSEDLRYDSVVAVNPGLYEAVLTSTDGQVKSKAELVALNRESYVLLRVGIEAQAGESYPQELVAFPNSDPSMLKGMASSLKVSTLALVFVAALFWN